MKNKFIAQRRKGAKLYLDATIAVPYAPPPQLLRERTGVMEKIAADL
jgi:hypothetical protein